MRYSAPTLQSTGCDLLQGGADTSTGRAAYRDRPLAFGHLSALMLPPYKSNRHAIVADPGEESYDIRTMSRNLLILQENMRGKEGGAHRRIPRPGPRYRRHDDDSRHLCLILRQNSADRPELRVSGRVSSLTVRHVDLRRRNPVLRQPPIQGRPTHPQRLRRRLPMTIGQPDGLDDALPLVTAGLGR